ncbi:MAG: hypothetical protein R3D00_21205 [Bacteroidia bacterium]
MKAGFIFLIMFAFIVPLAFAGQMEATGWVSKPYAMEDDTPKKLLVTAVTAFGATAWTIILGINALLLGLIVFLGLRGHSKSKKARLSTPPYSTIQTAGVS